MKRKFKIGDIVIHKDRFNNLLKGEIVGNVSLNFAYPNHRLRCGYATNIYTIIELSSEAKHYVDDKDTLLGIRFLYDDEFTLSENYNHKELIRKAKIIRKLGERIIKNII